MNFEKEEFLVEKKDGPKSFRSIKSFGPKMFGSNKWWVQKVWVKQNSSSKKLVKMGSVAAEIYLIWTNVAKTNVTWINVTVIVG